MRTLLLFRGAVILRSGVCRNRIAENSDLNAIATGLNNNRIILQADNPSDDAALRENLISNFKCGAHRSLFFLLLSLRQKHDQVDDNKHHRHHDIGAGRVGCR